MVKRWPRYLDWKVKGQLVSFAFCSSNHSFLLLFLFLPHRPRPLSPCHLPPFPSSPSPPYSSPPSRHSSFPVLLSFLSFVLTLPLFSSLCPVLILPCYSSFLIPSSPSGLPLPPPLPKYSFAYKFPLRINFFVPLTRVHLMSWLSYL